MERKTVPILIKNVDLQVDISINTQEEFEKFQWVQELLQRMRATFGDNVLIDELSQVLCGQIEKVTLTGGPLELPSDRQPPIQAPRVVTLPAQGQSPSQPPIAPPAPPSALYAIVSECPWRGMSLQALNPQDVARILQDPAKKAVLHPQDVFYMEEYVKSYYATKPQTHPAVAQVPLQLDQILF